MRPRAFAILAALVLAACGSSAPSAQGRLTVFAAASLTDAFEKIGADFTAANPGVDVAFNFGSSSTLATQITEGAPADVFASASPQLMDALVAADLVAGRAVDFAGNRLAIAVEAGNPLEITTLRDLERPNVTLVIADVAVPAGQYAREMLDAQGIAVTPSSLEVDVRAALARVVLGEADAAIVYASDITSADAGVDGVTIPADVNVHATYPIAALAAAADPTIAQAFVDHVVSPQGQDVLGAHGFDAP